MQHAWSVTKHVASAFLRKLDSKSAICIVDKPPTYGKLSMGDHALNLLQTSTMNVGRDSTLAKANSLVLSNESGATVDFSALLDIHSIQQHHGLSCGACMGSRLTGRGWI